MKIILSLFISLLVFTAQAGFEEGVDAMKSGDHKTAIYNFKKALNEEDDMFKPMINKFLAVAYRDATDDIDSDFKLTFRAFKESSKRYSQHANSVLGVMHFFGQGTDQDYNKAKEHFELANKYSDSRRSLWML